MKESSQVPKRKLREVHNQNPKVEDLAHAEIEIIRSVQHEHFEEEIIKLRSLNAYGEFLSREAVEQRYSEEDQLYVPS